MILVSGAGGTPPKHKTKTKTKSYTTLTLPIIIMLSGIKTGKRKRPANTASCPSSSDNSNRDGHSSPAPAPAAARAAPSSGNKSAADELRATLMSGSHTSSLISKKNEDTFSNLESRGRISNQVISSQDTIVIPSARSSTNKTTNDSTKIIYNSKGKLSRSKQNELRTTTDAEMTISEMLQQEREQTANMDEIYARNIAKMGKSYKKYDNMQQNSRSKTDEDDYLQTSTLLSDRLYRNAPVNSTAPSIVEAKEKSRALAHFSAFEKWKAKSWWWMESPSFDNKYLIALGDKVSLVLVPSKYALVEGHCYIVPLSYSESFVNVDEEIWSEVKKFQRSLSQMYNSRKKKLIFLETASQGGASGLQCKMEVIPVPARTEEDAPFYFKSSLGEVAQEWGTHQKPIVLNSQKTLRNAVPKGFPYFYCGWSDGNEGYVQLIEGEDDGLGGTGESSSGRNKYRDFGLDTVAGMMGLDPYRMRKKGGRGGREDFDAEKREILRFCEQWKGVDWTRELDG